MTIQEIIDNLRKRVESAKKKLKIEMQWMTPGEIRELEEFIECNTIIANALQRQENFLADIAFAIASTDATDVYSVGMRNGLKYARYLQDGKDPEYDEYKPRYIEIQEEKQNG